MSHNKIYIFLNNNNIPLCVLSAVTFSKHLAYLQLVLGCQVGLRGQTWITFLSYLRELDCGNFPLISCCGSGINI